MFDKTGRWAADLARLIACDFLHGQAALVQPAWFQAEYAVNAAKPVRVHQQLNAKRRFGRKLRQTRGQSDGIIGHAGKARRGSVIKVLIARGKAAPIIARRGGIPATMQRRLLAETGVVP